MTSTTSKTRAALWSPGWYMLDQPLTVGTRQRFWFFQSPPCDFPNAEAFDFIFFNKNCGSPNVQVREADVIRIQHEQLGELNSIDTGGLDYVFKKADGSAVIVNAEEDPGTVYDAPVIILDWSVQVELGNVSEIITTD